MKRLGVFILLFFSAAGVHAQDPAAIAAVRDADLPPDVRARLEAIVADPGTVVFRGTTRIRAGEEVARPVVVQGGALVVAGVARGPVAVIRGALEIEPGGIVEGDVFLIDSSFEAAETARVGGTVTRVGDVARIPSLRIRPAAPGNPPKATYGVSGVVLGSGLARARVGAAYDRIRGMAVRVGPELTFPSGESNHLHLYAAAEFRSETTRAFDLRNDIGYRAGLMHTFGPREELALGAGIRSEIDPIERRGLSGWEAALSSAVLHRDPWDYVARSGWSVWGSYVVPTVPFAALVEYRDEDEGAVTAADPWSMLRRADAWRLQPVVAEGRLRSITVNLRFDSRPELREPGTGLYADLRVTRALGGSLRTQPFALLSGTGSDGGPNHVAPYGPWEIDEPFTLGALDLRGYVAVREESRLSARLWLGGALSGSPLPPQYQHALGGAGTLPGFSGFTADCSARSRDGVTFRDTEAFPVYPAYGCDRAALFQAEYRGKLNFRFGYDEIDRGESPEGLRVVVSPAWVAFLDVGRGWQLAGGMGGAHRVDTPTLVDAGLGLVFGSLGVYAAVPVEGPGSGVRFTASLGHRF